MRNITPLLTTLFLLAQSLLFGCAAGGFQFNRLAKSDIDMVSDIHWQTADGLVQGLMKKLYLRNPNELRKNNGKTIEQLQRQLRNLPLDQQTRSLGVGNLAAMDLALSQDYQGDRVFALIAGLRGMISDAYGYQSSFYLTDSIDAQKLYNSARNVEILAWKLNQAINYGGEPLILSNSVETGSVNLSYERLFGKLIANQDTLAKVMEDKTQRTVNRITHGVISMTFIPI